jgi:hypothetical protein
VSKIFAIILGIVFALLCYQVDAGNLSFSDQSYLRYGYPSHKYSIRKPHHKLPHRKWWGGQYRKRHKCNTGYGYVVREPQQVIVINQAAPIQPSPPKPKYEVIYTWVPEKREKIMVPVSWDCEIKEEWVNGYRKFSTNHELCRQVPEHEEFQVVQDGYYTEKRVRID